MVYILIMNTHLFFPTFQQITPLLEKNIEYFLSEFGNKPSMEDNSYNHSLINPF